MTYVDWFNHRRLHGEITNDASYTTPAEAEADYYRQTTTAPEVVNQPEQSPDPGVGASDKRHSSSLDSDPY